MVRRVCLGRVLSETEFRSFVFLGSTTSCAASDDASDAVAENVALR